MGSAGAGSSRPSTRELSLHRVDLGLTFQGTGTRTRAFVEETFLKKQDRYHPDRDRGIGQVKDRAKELKLVATDKGEPGGVMRFYDREIEHIHHPPMEKAGIPMGRKELCHMIIGTALKDQSIEHAVQQIAKGPGKDETGADDKSAVIFLLDDGLDIIYPEDHGDQPKKRQGHLAPGTAELPAPGHAFVLYKIDLRFVAQ